MSYRLLAILVPSLTGCIAGLENDVGGFGGGSDRNYTSGVRLQHDWERGHPVGVLDGWADRLVSKTDRFAPRAPSGFREDHAVSLALGQSMYTPLDLTRSDVIADDRPYAGWLYVGLTRHDSILDEDTSRRDDLQISLGVDLGIVGPESLAEQTQKAVHELIGSQDPKGWSHQLSTEAGVILKLARKSREFFIRDVCCGLQLDGISGIALSLGNVSTLGSAGYRLRLGFNLPRDFGVDTLEYAPVFSREDLQDGGPETSVFVFGGIDGRLVVRDIFLDGNSYRSSHSVTKEIFVAEYKFGIAVHRGDFRVSYTRVARTREFKRQDDPHSFGSVMIGWSKRY